MNRAYLSLGSNIGNKENNLQLSRSLISESVGRIIKTSPLYRTAPWQMNDAEDFINQVIAIETELSAQKLLDALLEIERRMGRIRNEKKYESRTIDIDIIFYNNDIILTEIINIPHPLLHKRRFVLQPLFDIAAEYIHPVSNKTVSQLLLECTDDSVVTQIKSK